MEGIHQAACQQAASERQPPEFKIIHRELLEFHLWSCAFRQFTLLAISLLRLKMEWTACGGGLRETGQSFLGQPGISNIEPTVHKLNCQPKELQESVEWFFM